MEEQIMNNEVIETTMETIPAMPSLEGVIPDITEPKTKPNKGSKIKTTAVVAGIALIVARKPVKKAGEKIKNSFRGWVKGIVKECIDEMEQSKTDPVPTTNPETEKPTDTTAEEQENK